MKRRNFVVRGFVIFALLFSFQALGASSFEIDSVQEKHHITADRTLYHSREGVYEAFGHVVVGSKGQRLSCDYLWLDEKTRDIKARGNVIFVDHKVTIQAAEIHFNLDSGFGSIFYGKVFNDLYSLKGQLIRKVREDRFLTTDGEYTTCKDCAESWKLAAKNVDVTVDGYAFMDSVYIKIKDVPTLYLPFLVVPVKTRRQSGLLFPRIGANSSHGFVYLQPLFVAIDDHQDMTIGAGKYSSRGLRQEFEYRFKSYDGIGGNLNFFRTEDRKSTFSKHRTAFWANSELPFSENLGFRWRVQEVFDRDYPIDFPEDMPGKGLPSLESNLLIYAPFKDFFLSLEAKRYRNLLYDKATGFDGGTVQALPTAHFGLRDRKIWGPLTAGIYGRYDVFRRRNGSFQDSDRNKIFDPGQDQIRETNRLILQPVISAPFRLGNFLSMAPSLQYNEIQYSFAVPTANGPVPPTRTRYLLAKMETSLVFERVFDFDGVNFNKIKHQVSPFLTFSNIPWISQGNSGHPFNGSFGQLVGSSGLFDQFDVVPLTNDTNFLRYPQGKSIYYGLTSRLIRKARTQDEMLPRAYPYDRLKPKPKVYPKPLNRKMELQNEYDRLWDTHDPGYGNYQEIWTVTATQAYDFKNAERLGDKKRAFSYLLARSDFGVERFSHSLEYRFFPRIVNRLLNSAGSPIGETVFSNKHFVTTGFGLNLQNLTNLRRTRSFVRKLNGNFTASSQPNLSRTVGGGLDWSFNDFIKFSFGYGYDLLSSNQLSWSANTLLTHHSECWGIFLRYDWQRNRTPQRSEFGFELLLNLMGTGFMGQTQLAESTPASIFGGL